MTMDVDDDFRLLLVAAVSATSADHTPYIHVFVSGLRRGETKCDDGCGR